MEHYDCRRQDDDYRLGDAYNIKTDHLIDDSGYNLILRISDIRAYSAKKEQSFLLCASDQKANIFYCPELKEFLSADQVVGILDRLCELKEDYDSWKYFSEYY